MSKKSSTDDKAIRAVVARWHEATAAGDVEAVLELMDEEAVFLVVGQPPMKGRAKFASSLRKVLKTHSIVSRGDVLEVEVAGRLAYCWTALRVRMKNRSDGSSSVRKGPTLSIFRKNARGTWVLLRDANLLPPPG